MSALGGRCKKCGGSSISTKYEASDGYLFGVGEHLIKKCANCGYTWSQPTLDSLEAINETN